MDNQKHLTDYLICALWSSTDENVIPFDADYGIEDIADESLEVARIEVGRFMKDAQPFLSDDDSHQVPGHDFWLTRNGHGAGFWDGDYINGDKLTELSKEYGECYVYLGNDGKLYIN